MTAASPEPDRPRHADEVTEGSGPSWAPPAVDLPAVDLDPAGVADLELLVTGALAPVRGYLTAAEADHASRRSRLPDGRPCPLPVTLVVDGKRGATAREHPAVVLRDPEGVPLATVRVTEVADRPDGSAVVAGEVATHQLPVRPDFPELRRSPAAVRAEIAARGWCRVLAVAPDTTTGPAVLPAARRLASRLAAGLLVQVAVAPHRLDDPRPYRRIRAFRQAVGPDELLTVVETRRCGPAGRGIAHRGRVAVAAGATDLAVPVDTPPLVGELVPELVLHPLPGPPAQPPARAPRAPGVCVFFTGLSGSGKSTIAGALVAQLLERTDRTVSLLDGDVVRRHLSAGLGFSREDRDTNIRRIGFVAAEVVKHGGVAVCAPIAPYQKTRAEVRRLVTAVGGFLLVLVDTPVAVCEQRDRKGLYAKARAGLLPAFTGVTDPYERPTDPDLVVDTARLTPGEAAAAVMDRLRRDGYL